MFLMLGPQVGAMMPSTSTEAKVYLAIAAFTLIVLGLVCAIEI